MNNINNIVIFEGTTLFVQKKVKIILVSKINFSCGGKYLVQINDLFCGQIKANNWENHYLRLVPKPTDAMSLENHGFRGQNWQKLPLAPVTDGTLLFNTNTNINLDCTGLHWCPVVLFFVNSIARYYIIWQSETLYCLTLTTWSVQ